MNKIKNNNLDYFQRVDSRKRAAVLQEYLISQDLFNEVQKMHQKTTWQEPLVERQLMSNELEDYLSLVVHTDVIPNYSENTIQLLNKRRVAEQRNSVTIYKPDYIITLEKIGEILYSAFGRTEGISTKPYPSAGGLYPILPILLIFNNTVVNGVQQPGAYLYNSMDDQLLLIKTFDDSTIKEIESNLIGTNKILSPIALVYAMDIKRAITKYKKRGYRHALIEVGLMAQSFRHSLWSENLVDSSWSGFNDNIFTHLIGLSPRLAPIALIQWFGKQG